MPNSHATDCQSRKRILVPVDGFIPTVRFAESCWSHRRKVLQFPYLPPHRLLAPSMNSFDTSGWHLSRRGFIQTGYSAALGLGLAGLMPRRATGAEEKPRKAKSVVIVFLTGAASHTDTFDVKPDAPAEIR